MKRRKNSELLLMSGNPSRRRKNPAELVMLSANPLKRKRNPYDKLSVDERLAFGRLGLGKAQLQSTSDIQKARRQVRQTERLRNRLPNPGAGSLPSVESPSAEHSQNLFEEFHAHPT